MEIDDDERRGILIWEALRDYDEDWAKAWVEKNYTKVAILRMEKWLRHHRKEVTKIEERVATLKALYYYSAAQYAHTKDPRLIKEIAGQVERVAKAEMELEKEERKRAGVRVHMGGEDATVENR